MSQTESSQSSSRDAVQLPLPADSDLAPIDSGVQETLTAVARRVVAEEAAELSGPELRDRLLLALESECEEMTVPDVREFRVTTNVEETASYPEVLQTLVRNVLPHVFERSSVSSDQQTLA